MARWDKTLDAIVRGTSDANIAFGDFRSLLDRLRFQERIRGDHHVFTKDGVVEIVNVQPLGTKAKAYQIKQVRNLILKYGLGAKAQ
jgi:hypothetical protein